MLNAVIPFQPGSEKNRICVVKVNGFEQFWCQKNRKVFQIPLVIPVASGVGLKSI